MSELTPLDKIRQRSPVAVRLAEQALKAGKIRPIPGTTRSDCLAVLAKTLTQTHPKSEHGQLLMRALTPATGRLRSPEEKTVRWLIRRGDSPTPEAVSGRLANLKERADRANALSQEALKLAETDALRAAKTVAETLDRTGEAPSWRELSLAMGWPYSRKRLVNMIFIRLRGEGWLDFSHERRSLRPGRRYYAAVNPEEAEK